MANKKISFFVDKTFTNVGYVLDIVRGMFLAVHSPAAAGQAYFIGEDRIYDSEEIVGLIAKSVGKKTFKVRVPYPVIYGLASVIEGIASVTKSHPLVRKRYLSEYLKTHSRFSMGKAAEDFGFSAAYPLEKGLKLTADWHKEHGFKL
jgi:nucleoside-diphosphate-sugar epimerase